MSLVSLFVRDFAIVRQLELEFDTGLTVMTGETGAGKSILIDALALTLGDRAETGNIRHGADRAEIVASFEVGSESQARAWLENHELLELGDCITRRIVYREKPSRAYINGRPVTAQTLKELGALLVDIHGQHEHQSLLHRETQRHVVDAYGGLSEQVRQLSDLYERHQLLQSRLQSITDEASDRSSRADMLRYQINELDSLGMTAGEYESLDMEHRRLAHASELLDGLSFISQTLYHAEDHTASGTIATCIQRLDALVDYAPELGGMKNLLSEAQIQIDEAATQLSQMQDKVELDPQRLTWVEQRLATVLDLSRKHHCEPNALPECLDSLRSELETLDGSQTNADELTQAVADIRAEYLNLAMQVSAARGQAARHLSDEITRQMQQLGMAGGRFHVELETGSEELTRYGLEQTEFQVYTNSEQPLRPLAKVASGGELSRIGLALQVITAETSSVPTLVFDEVDVGIGGSTAEIVGHKLRSLGGSRQVLCITHLPQVASQGCAHLQIYKEEQDGVVVNIQSLDSQSRVEEIARMLGGIEITEQTRAHARDMLKRAAQ